MKLVSFFYGDCGIGYDENIFDQNFTETLMLTLREVR